MEAFTINGLFKKTNLNTASMMTVLMLISIMNVRSGENILIVLGLGDKQWTYS